MRPKHFKAIIGLGNPGDTYKRTRHNAGAKAVEALSKLEGMDFRLSRSFKSLIATGEIAENPVLLVLPQTFMNLSGEAVSILLKKRNITFENLLVVYDDAALALGAIRLRSTGSDGGHNGLSSIIERIGTKDFSRLRLGIGSPGGDQDLSDFVLSNFRKEEEESVGLMIKNSTEAMRMWVAKGIVPAMNSFNKK
ncbi:MAG TPA: aminoacyl-tRNA hydrolase [Candidatus Omnitrophota bacterium]|nr:aminoacyl-tRNA hydrolase [Candidatus Omnitrophota bacterium]